MNIKQECIAMLLAGGQGSRLGVLTDELAKPAVPFGGKYRIIDFTLSNCINSGIETVGILTQYQPHELTAYIGNGRPWDLDRMTGGVHILPPYVRGKAGQWYKGTANAIYQNISFIDRISPKNVLILSGDHIYKMDYSKMIRYHNQVGAACTIAVMEVPLSEASRFGIMNTDSESKIIEFQEKPKNPKSTKASMGVYVFDWETLRAYLVNDENKQGSQNDFGKNIIPAMLEAGEPMWAYGFSGYWKDVGTIESLWDANMDMLNPEIPLDLNDPRWKVYSKNPVEPPAFIGDGKVTDSMIAEGAEVLGDVYNSIISYGVYVGAGAKVENSVIMPGARIEDDAAVRYAIVGEDAVISSGGIVNGESGKIPVVGSKRIIDSGRVVNPGEIVR